jgi:hypothetical protein
MVPRNEIFARQLTGGEGALPALAERRLPHILSRWFLTVLLRLYLVMERRTACDLAAPEMPVVAREVESSARSRSAI